MSQVQLQRKASEFLITLKSLIYHKPIIGPASKLHHTLLLVEGEELDVNAAVRLVDGWGVPLDPAVPVEDSLGHDRHLVVPVSAENGKVGIKKISIKPTKKGFRFLCIGLVRAKRPIFRKLLEF